MNCFKCEGTAMGICRFCGRGVCGEHVSHRPYILSALPGEHGGIQVLAVEDALFCGGCSPRDEFVTLTGGES